MLAWIIKLIKSILFPTLESAIIASSMKKKFKLIIGNEETIFFSGNTC